MEAGRWGRGTGVERGRKGDTGPVGGAKSTD